jgi:hypothetical protein
MFINHFLLERRFVLNALSGNQGVTAELSDGLFERAAWTVPMLRPVVFAISRQDAPESRKRLAAKSDDSL